MEGADDEDDEINEYGAEESEDEEGEGLFGDAGSDTAFKDLRDDFDGAEFGINDNNYTKDT